MCGPSGRDVIAPARFARSVRSVVTGGASGIGLASVQAMLAADARVVMIDRHEAALAALSREHGDAIVPMPTDPLDLNAYASSRRAIDRSAQTVRRRIRNRIAGGGGVARRLGRGERGAFLDAPRAASRFLHPSRVRSGQHALPRRREALPRSNRTESTVMPLSAQISRSVLASACIACFPHPASAHDDHCSAVTDSIEEAGFSDEVSVSCENGHANLVSDAYPDHEMMTGIVGTNEQVPVPAHGLVMPIPLEPTLGDTPLTRDSSLGVAVNGVPIFDYTAGGDMSEDDLHHHQTQHDTLLTWQLDACGGHAGRADDYHYHVKPACMIEAMDNRDDDPIIGWALDGFPIYGDDNPDGSAVAADALDVCNGQPDEAYGYRYHTSEEAPYIVQCLVGEVGDPRELPRIPPMRAADGGSEPEAGRPPSGGVENLTFTESPDGERSLDYSYEGEAWYIRYGESDTPGCYDFETRTVTNDGAVLSRTLCR